MAIIIEAPNEVYSLENNRNTKIFLAGGISNCPDWQSELIKKLEGINKVTLYNPRRANFPMDDPNASEAQITWEYNKLKESNIIIYWFSRGSLNPIVLYELGKWAFDGRGRAVIGIDPEYERRQDVEIQTRLAQGKQGERTIFHSTLDEIAEAVKDLLPNSNLSEKDQLRRIR